MTKVQEKYESYPLSNGLTIKVTGLGKNGYYGVASAKKWQRSQSGCGWIAAVNLPTDPALVALLTASRSTSLHLGHYSDPREAAYVTALYDADPLSVLQSIHNSPDHMFSVDFPPELYLLPMDPVKTQNKQRAKMEYAQECTDRILELIKNGDILSDSTFTALTELRGRLEGEKFIKSF